MGGERSELCYAGVMKRIPEDLTTYARALRNGSTKAERLLWVRLRQYRPRFTRQLVVEPYIVDLACREARDGSIDKLREKYAVRRATLEQKVERAREVIARESQQAASQRMDVAISVGSVLAGAILGRRMSRRTGKAVRSACCTASWNAPRAW